MVALQGLETPLDAGQVRAAVWGQDTPFEALGTESLADALPARFETLSYLEKDEEALIVNEALSLNLVSWQGRDGGETDPFEALDDCLPAQHLTVAHFDPAQGRFGLLFADDGILKRRLFINSSDSAAWVSTGTLGEHEQKLWEASDLDGLAKAEDLPTRLADLQEDILDHLQIVLTSLLANRLRFGFCLDLLNPSGAIWAESVASFCLDEDDSQ